VEVSILNENLFTGRRGVLGGKTDRHTDMTKPVVAFLNFANALKKE
jgi:hypothetical protein